MGVGNVRTEGLLMALLRKERAQHQNTLSHHLRESFHCQLCNCYMLHYMSYDSAVP